MNNRLPFSCDESREQLLRAALKNYRGRPKRNRGSDCEPAGTKEIIMDAAVASVLSELGGIFILKGEQRTALKAFLNGKDVFASLPTGFSKSFVERHCATLLAKGW